MRAESNREGEREGGKIASRREKEFDQLLVPENPPPKTKHKGLGLMRLYLPTVQFVSVEHRKSPLLSEPYSCSPTYEEDSAHYWRMSCWGGRLLGTYLPTWYLAIRGGGLLGEEEAATCKCC